MAEKVKELRGLIYSMCDSEAEFAKKIGWSRQRLNKITGGIKMPNLEELEVLAVALNHPIGEVARFFLQSKSPNGQQ